MYHYCLYQVVVGDGRRPARAPLLDVQQRPVSRPCDGWPQAHRAWSGGGGGGGHLAAAARRPWRHHPEPGARLAAAFGDCPVLLRGGLIPILSWPVARAIG